MLHIHNRIPKGDFHTVLKNAKTLSLPLFVCKWRNGSGGQSRFSVVVSSSICKRAVDRNRKRRQLYEAIRLHKLEKTPHYDIVLFAKKALAGTTYKEIEKNIILLNHKLYPHE